MTRKLTSQTSSQVMARLEYIELSHYAGMTETLCQDIITDARKRFPIDTVRVVHRVGKLYAGDQIVFGCRG